MKVNRFGMSQKVFMTMVERWFITQVYIAQALRHNNAKEDALKRLDEADTVAKKTFIDGEPFEMQEHRRMWSSLREEITQELSALAAASAPSS